MLGRKGLLAHVQVVNDPAEVDEIWLLNDIKVLGQIAQGVSLEHHTKIRPVASVIQAWNTLRDFYNRTTIHNGVTMTRRLHEFKIEDGTTIDSRLPAESKLITSIVENSRDVILTEVKVKLLMGYERQKKKETTE
ncbi:polyprotein [Phytophthora palmivora]|uniref:Polyprotein n=1 Tax=Phytophthora palmivora TaxID=4796 RepID=A0A2P4X5A9_9STRA|nr:polyprotein [Phytophthora palmivora]